MLQGVMVEKLNGFEHENIKKLETGQIFESIVYGIGQIIIDNETIILSELDKAA